MIRLADCTVTITPRLITTRLPSGLLVHGEPHDTDSYRQTAREHGYGDDVARLNRVHELTHSLLAHWIGLSASPVFERIARGVMDRSDETDAEEAAVLAIERYANAIGVDLERVAERFGCSTAS